MKRFAFLSMTMILLLLVSCASTSGGETTERFSLERTTGTAASSTGLLMGTVRYGASGYYFPASSDILDISLLKTDSITGLVTEVSHQRLRNFQKFPIQFTVRYDNADIGESDICTLIVTLLIDGQVKGQGLSLLTRTSGGFSDADLTLLSI